MSETRRQMKHHGSTLNNTVLIKMSRKNEPLRRIAPSDESDQTVTFDRCFILHQNNAENSLN